MTTSLPTTRGPKILTGVGIVLLLIGIAAVAFGATRLADGLRSVVEASESSEELLGAEAGPVGEALQLTGLADHRYSVLHSTSSGPEVQPGDVRIAGPDGEPVSVEDRNVERRLEIGGQTNVEVASFRTTEAGSYTLTVSGTSASVGGDIAVVDDEVLEDLLVGGLRTVGIVAAGALVSVVGLGIAVAGGIWWGVRHGARKRAALAAPARW
ncbi:hypothetical protein [Sanguibacter suaedae]|uniref:Uncharacterized protein n=1 Tax=Sanguibacter suaedae TaxID=2795737 RepID=A0A934ICG4_9MICO|nr:hypothetical protein [Sanguibacter suaedae]MBI9115311.1 hypothetical protein [Sanguibacter suaedae]